MSSASCGDCRYAELTIAGDDLVTECQRFPPTLVEDPAEGDLVRAFPQVDGSDWCGEYLHHRDPF